MTPGDHASNHHRCTRVEVIGPNGREYVAYVTAGIGLAWQDGDRTLKVFIGEHDEGVKDELVAGLRRDLYVPQPLPDEAYETYPTPMGSSFHEWLAARKAKRAALDIPALAPTEPVEPRKPSEGTTGADEHDRPLWSAMDK